MRGFVRIYPGTDNRDAAWSYPSRVANADVPPLTRATMEYFLASFLPDQSKAEDWRVSPLLVQRVADVAPVLLITGGCDVLHDEGVKYATRLSEAGVAVTHRNFPGMIHGFIEMAGVLSATNIALDTIAFMLRQCLAPPTSAC
jgi:acetyl esterase